MKLTKHRRRRQGWADRLPWSVPRTSRIRENQRYWRRVWARLRRGEIVSCPVVTPTQRRDFDAYVAAHPTETTMGPKPETDGAVFREPVRTFYRFGAEGKRVLARCEPGKYLIVMEVVEADLYDTEFQIRGEDSR